MRRWHNWSVGIAGVCVLVLAGCGGGGQTTSTTSATVAAQTTTTVGQPSASDLKVEARQRKKDAAESKKRELLAKREAAERRRREAARHRREAAERRAEEDLGHGLGAKKSKFNAENTIGEGSDPPVGVAWWHVMYTLGGDRVAAFNINVNFDPVPSTHELISLMSVHNLPDDAHVITEHASCIVWRSPTLGRLLGSEYAEGFVEPEGEGKYAELITTMKPECT